MRGDLNSSTDDRQCHYRELAENLQRQLSQVRSESDDLQHTVDAQLTNQGHSQKELVQALETELSCIMCTKVVIEVNIYYIFCRKSLLLNKNLYIQSIAGMLIFQPTVAQCGHFFAPTVSQLECNNPMTPAPAAEKELSFYLESARGTVSSVVYTTYSLMRLVKVVNEFFSRDA